MRIAAAPEANLNMPLPTFDADSTPTRSVRASRSSVTSLELVLTGIDVALGRS